MCQADELSWNLPFARSLSDRLFYLASCLRSDSEEVTAGTRLTSQFTDGHTLIVILRQATSDKYINATRQKIRKLRWHDR